MDLAFIHECEI